MSRLLMLAVICIVVLIDPEAPQAEDGPGTAPPFIVGVARQDGVIVPFGLYKNRHWIKIGVETCSDQPTPGNTAEVLAALTGMKGIPPAWFLWTEDNEQPVVMKVSKPVIVQSHCCQQWGLATGPNIVFKAGSFPFPKLGLALSKPCKVELMGRLDATEEDAKSLLAFFSPHFDRLEDVALQTKQDYLNGLTQREVLNAFYGVSIGSSRQPVPLRLSKAFGSRNVVNGRTLFYVEVFKEYRAASCSVVGYSSCWISKDSTGAFTLLSKNATSVGFFDCDWKGADFFTPLGIVVADNLTYVLGQTDVWENEEYVIHEVLDEKVRLVLHVNGGGC